MKMWVESRPARSKPEGVTASRHADPLVCSPCTLPCFLPPLQPEHRLILHGYPYENKKKKDHSKPKKFRIYIKKREDFEQDLAADQIIVV